MNSVLLLHNIFSLSLSEENPKIFIWIVDFSYLLNARIHFNIDCSIAIILALISQYFHYIDFKNNKTPTYLKPFEMIEGLVSPQSFELTDKADISKFIQLCKKWFLFTKIYSNITKIAVLICYTLLIISCPLIPLIIYVLRTRAILTIQCQQ